MKMITEQLLSVIVLAHSVLAWQYPIRPTRTITPTYSSISVSYAPPYSELSSLGPTSLTYTTYALNSTATDTDDKYGQASYAALWSVIPNVTAPPFTTTVSPTKVPASSLIYPTIRNDFIPKNLKFGKDFSWGLDSSAQQYEGAVQEQGRGPSIFDKFFHEKVVLAFGVNNSDIASMGYYYYKQDIANMAAMGVKNYSFSISWSRILPFGEIGSPVNQQGIDHYNDVIDTCLEYGIEPMITIFHWDTPMLLSSEFFLYTSDLGILNVGAANTTFTDNLVHYAKIIMNHYADRVSSWITINEPQVICSNLTGAYNILMAHAKIADYYRNTINGTGQISFKNANQFAIPFDPKNETDIEAANRYNELTIGVFSNPIYLNKSWPEEITNTTWKNAIPTFSNEDLDLLSDSQSFFAMDMYGAQVVRAVDGGIENCISNKSNSQWPYCVIQSNIDDSGFLVGRTYTSAGITGNAIAETPGQIRVWLQYLWAKYKPKGIVVSEFGTAQASDEYASVNRQRYDQARADFLISYLQNILWAKTIDKINVIGTFIWSNVDDWEWGNYNDKFGVQYLNRTTFERSYKMSFFSLADFFGRHTRRSNGCCDECLDD